MPRDSKGEAHHRARILYDVSSPSSGFSKSCEEVIFATSAAEGKVYDTELIKHTPEAAVRSGGIGMTRASLEDRIGECVTVVAFFGVEAREAVPCMVLLHARS